MPHDRGIGADRDSGGIGIGAQPRDKDERGATAFAVERRGVLAETDRPCPAVSDDTCPQVFDGFADGLFRGQHHQSDVPGDEQHHAREDRGFVATAEMAGAADRRHVIEGDERRAQQAFPSRRGIRCPSPPPSGRSIGSQAIGSSNGPRRTVSTTTSGSQCNRSGNHAPSPFVTKRALGPFA